MAPTAPMAMFPLGSVLLPGGVLPLHVFEPRYRQMVIDLLQQDGTPEFGQALITRGTETGGEDERAVVGTAAQIVNIEALDESRYALVAVGTRRIRIDEWLPDDPYPRATVEDWPDEDAAAGELEAALAQADARVRAVLRLAADTGDVDPSAAETEVSPEPVMATYHLSALAPVGEADRHRLLCAPGPVQRLEVLGHVLDDVEAMLRFRLG